MLHDFRHRVQAENVLSKDIAFVSALVDGILNRGIVRKEQEL